MLDTRGMNWTFLNKLNHHLLSADKKNPFFAGVQTDLCVSDAMSCYMLGTCYDLIRLLADRTATQFDRLS